MLPSVPFGNRSFDALAKMGGVRMQGPYATNQRWTYAAPESFEHSRIVIGAIVTCPENDRIICVSVTGAPRREPTGELTAVTIPFLPLTEAAFAETVREPDGLADPAPGFADALATWSRDERGLSMFTVPFDGFLDKLIARQMTEIVEGQTA